MILNSLIDVAAPSTIVPAAKAASYEPAAVTALLTLVTLVISVVNCG